MTDSRTTSQMALAALVEFSAEAIMSTDREGRVIRWNWAAEGSPRVGMEAGGSLRRLACLVADSLRGAPYHLVDPATGPDRGGQNWGDSVIESGEIPLIVVNATAVFLEWAGPGRQAGSTGVVA